MVQLSISGILAAVILAIAPVGAVPGRLGTLLGAVPSPRNKHYEVRLGDCRITAHGVDRTDGSYQ